MPKAYVLNDSLSEADRSAVDGILTQHGYSPVHGVPSDTSTIDKASDIAVICLPIAEAEVMAVNQKAMDLSHIGVRIVAIWLHDVADELPESVEKYGSAAVGIGSAKLPDALGGQAIWEEPTGMPRPEQSIPRNKC